MTCLPWPLACCAGKSTLAALLAARLGISTVVSTDSIRHMLRRQARPPAPMLAAGRGAAAGRSLVCATCATQRVVAGRARLPHPANDQEEGKAARPLAPCSFTSEEEDPLLWASTYQAGAHLQQLAAAQAAHAAGAQAAAAAAGDAGRGGLPPGGAPGAGAPRPPLHPGAPLRPGAHWQAVPAAAGLDARKAAVRGYKAQAARVLEHVDRLLSGGHGVPGAVALRIRCCDGCAVL